MLVTAPRLYIRRPSPTTAEFTVTTCPPLTLRLRLLLAALFLLRLLVLTTAILVLHARFFLQQSAPSPSSSSSPHSHSHSPPPPSPPPQFLALLRAGDIPSLLTTLLQALHQSPLGRATSAVQRALPLPDWAATALALAAGWAACCARVHTTESVLVLRGLGVQTSWMGGGGGWLGWVLGWIMGWGGGTRFIPTEKIRDVLINEAFRGWEVRYYLVVVVEGEEDVVVLFPGLLPRRKIVEAVWRGMRGCLFEEDGEEGEEDGGKG